MHGFETLPAESYHEYATRMRRTYWQQRFHRDAMERERAFLRGRATAGPDGADSPPPPPRQPPDPMLPPPGQPGFDYTFARAKYELEYGPIEANAARSPRARSPLSTDGMTPWRC